MKRISDKKLAKLGGKVPFSTISSKPKRIRKRPRTKSERARIYGPKGYVEWIHERPCVGCKIVGYSECAHIETGGTGRKADWAKTIPLCGFRFREEPHAASYYIGCHSLLHSMGRKWFEESYKIDLDACAEATSRAWQESQR